MSARPTELTFRLCGTLQEVRVSLPEKWDKQAQEDLEDQLTQAFSPESTATMHFHLDYELCKKGYMMDVLDEYVAPGRTLMLHFVRLPTACRYQVLFAPFITPGTVMSSFEPRDLWDKRSRIEVPLELSLEDSFRLVQNTLVDKLKEHPELSQMTDPAAIRHLATKPKRFGDDPSKMVMRFQVQEVQFPAGGRQHLDMSTHNEYVKRLHRVKDMFNNFNDAIGKSVKVDVDMTLLHEKGAVLDDLAELVGPQRLQAPLPTYVRLGDTDSPPGTDTDVPVVFPLYAELDQNQKINSLLLIMAWDFGNEMIADPQCATHVEFNKKYKLLPAYKSCKTLEDVQSELDKNQWQADPRPFLPSLSLTDFHILREQDWGVDIVSERSMKLAIRLINHFDALGVTSAQLSSIDSQFPAKIDRTAESIEVELLELLKATYLSKRTLFKKNSPSWKGDLWIRPQKLKQLYRFTGKLEEHLCQDLIDDDSNPANTRLYLEYHIWPKDEVLVKGL